MDRLNKNWSVSGANNEDEYRKKNGVFVIKTSLIY